MSRIDNQWFGQKSWASRHKKIIVGLFIAAILLFLSTLGYVYRKELVSAYQTVKSVVNEKISGKDEEKQPEKSEVPEEEPEEEQKPQVVPDKPMVALTFDDGPSIYTGKLLDKLEECDARATFFIMGDRVKIYADTLKRMQEIGCEIGNHTYSHKDLTKLTPEELSAEIDWTNQNLAEVLGSGTELVRPTYGAVNDVVLQSVPYPFVHWSVDTTDWQTKDAEAITNYILGIVQDGDIVLMHDIQSTTVDAMMTLIPALQEQGYQIVTVSEMMEARGIQMEPGQKYFHARK